MVSNQRIGKLKGRRYSTLYVEPKSQSDDSHRARARIGHYLNDHLVQEADLLIAKVCREKFGSGPGGHAYGHDWVDYVGSSLYLNDFLDLITLVHRAASEPPAEASLHTGTRQNLKDLSQSWVPFCREVFSEEGLGYEIDDAAGVHPFVDEEFQLAKHSSIGALQDARFAGALGAFENAYRHFASRPADTKAAIRSMFECVETLFQLQVGAELNRRNIEHKLVPALQQNNPSDDPQCWTAIGASLADWVKAFDPYRKGQADQAPPAPSKALCIFALSSGAAIARSLASDI